MENKRKYDTWARLSLTGDEKKEYDDMGYVIRLAKEMNAHDQRIRDLRSKQSDD